MTITQKKAILSALFFGLGLVSCSKETEIKYQEDSYQPRDILVKKSDKSLTSVKDLSSMDFSRELIINDETTPKEDITKNIELSLSCRTQSGTATYTHTTYWPNPTKIRILEIMPADLLLNLDSEPITCDLVYNATNFLGSTSTGKIHQLLISDKDTFSNLSGAHALNNRTVTWDSIKDAVIVPLENATGTIQCTDFSLTKPNLPLATTFGQLIDQTFIESKKPKSQTQTCRVLFRTASETVVSPIFRLDLSTKAPVVTYTFSARERFVSSMDGRQTVQIQVTNPNTFPLSFRLNYSSLTLKFRALLIWYSYAHMTSLQEAPLQFSIGNSFISPEDFEKDIEIPSSGTVTITARVLKTIKCAQRVAAADNDGVKFSKDVNMFLGFNMGLNMPVIAYWKSTTDLYLTTEASFAGTKANPLYSQLPHWDIPMDWTSKYYTPTTLDHLLSQVRWGQDVTTECR